MYTTKITGTASHPNSNAASNPIAIKIMAGRLFFIDAE
jgi:hypothetical protein